MRVLLYHRTSAADAGRPPQETLDELRRTAAAWEWTVVGEHHDYHPLHSGPRPELERVTARLAAKEADLVVVAELWRPFRDMRHLARLGARWLELGAGLVSLAEGVDGSTPAGRLFLEDLVRLLGALERGRHAEATRVGILRARLDAEKLGLPTRPGAVPVNRLEVKKLYEEGKGGRYLSQRAIVKTIKRSGGRISEGTLRHVLTEMREAGMLDEAKRSKLRDRVGFDHGGRPPVRLSYDAGEIDAMLARGLGPSRILRTAASLPKGTTMWAVRRMIAARREAVAAASAGKAS
jgi:DNA invertase Pin-like site-specific DNA recombinase